MKPIYLVSLSILLILLPGCASNPVTVYNDIRPEPGYEDSFYTYGMGYLDGGAVVMESYSAGAKIGWFMYYLSMFAIGAVITAQITDNTKVISAGGLVSLAPAVYVTVTWERDLPADLVERIESKPAGYRIGFGDGYRRATKEIRVLGMLTFILEGVLGFEDKTDEY